MMHEKTIKSMVQRWDGVFGVRRAVHVLVVLPRAALGGLAASRAVVVSVELLVGSRACNAFLCVHIHISCRAW